MRTRSWKIVLRSSPTSDGVERLAQAVRLLMEGTRVPNGEETNRVSREVEDRREGDER
jgi:hypothetical protein